MKLDSGGKINKFKARLVAKGYAQKYEIDYGDAFAPVEKINTIRILVSIIANEDWPLKQFDVKNALYGKVCKIRKALYGMKRSSRVWLGRFSNFMKQIGYKV